MAQALQGKEEAPGAPILAQSRPGTAFSAQEVPFKSAEFQQMRFGQHDQQFVDLIMNGGNGSDENLSECNDFDLEQQLQLQVEQNAQHKHNLFEDEDGVLQVHNNYSDDDDNQEFHKPQRISNGKLTPLAVRTSKFIDINPLNSADNSGENSPDSDYRRYAARVAQVQGQGQQQFRGKEVRSSQKSSMRSPLYKQHQLSKATPSKVAALRETSEFERTQKLTLPQVEDLESARKGIVSNRYENAHNEGAAHQSLQIIMKKGDSDSEIGAEEIEMNFDDDIRDVADVNSREMVAIDSNEMESFDVLDNHLEKQHSFMKSANKSAKPEDCKVDQCSEAKEGTDQKNENPEQQQEDKEAGVKKGLNSQEQSKLVSPSAPTAEAPTAIKESQTPETPRRSKKGSIVSDTKKNTKSQCCPGCSIF